MKKVITLVLKIILGLVLFILLGFISLYAMYDQPLPKGITGRAADAFANRILETINEKAYQQTAFLQWNFSRGQHRYQWAKKGGKVRVEWNDFNVLLHLKEPQKSLVFKNDFELKGTSKSKIIEKAVAMFNNDSFWLVAPFKLFDSGTIRQLVVLEDGTDGLLVTYASGGTTPGDSYLWRLDDDGMPASFKMWVKIIPIGGLEATWTNWKKMENGMMLPTSHQLGPLTLDMGDVKAFNTLPVDY